MPVNGPNGSRLQSLLSRHRIAVAAVAGLLLATLAYWPGLSGGFLFDDFINLRTLGDYGRIDDWRTLLYYLTSGIADPTGRPVSLATFLIDARDWPADPFPFKRTNLLLHLANGILLMLVIRRLERRLSSTPHAAAATQRDWIALLAGMLWLAHPFLVSTTLYVVQRHAMLPLTFVMLAFLCWDQAYQRLLEERRGRALAWSVLGVGGCTLLAGLSKPNGLLAPLLLLIATAVIYRPDLGFRPVATRARVQRLAGWVLGIPAALMLAYLISRVPGNLDVSGVRSFTLGERLLTQPRVLFDYLGHLLLPRFGGGGVFVEHYPASTGLLSPWTTLPALLGLLGLGVAAALVHRRHPLLAFALLFYLGAHLLESSVVMLELYFEHRNYLPTVFLSWPLARWLISGQRLPRLRRLLRIALPIALLLMTWQRSLTWGNPELLAAMAAAENPESMRAQVVAATGPSTAGSPVEAAHRLRAAIAEHGSTVELVFNLIGQECTPPVATLAPETLQQAQQAVAAETRFHQGIIQWFRSAIARAAAGDCNGLDFVAMQRLLDAMAANPRSRSNPNRRQNLLHLRGHLAMRRGEAAQALAWFNQSLDARPDLDTALNQAAFLGNQGRPDLAVAHLDHFLSLEPPTPAPIRNMQTLHGYLLHATGHYQREAGLLREALSADLPPPAN